MNMAHLRNSILFLLCIIFFSCNISHPYLKAELIAVIDKYPQNFIDYKDSIFYARKITLCFKIKNTTNQVVYIPLDDQLYSKHNSYIEVTYVNHSIKAPAHLFKNLTKVQAKDSTFMYVHLMDEQLSKLDLKEAYYTPEKIIRKIKYKYCIEEEKNPLNLSIPEIEFCNSNKIQYRYRSIDKLQIYE